MCTLRTDAVTSTLGMYVECGVVFLEGRVRWEMGWGWWWIGRRRTVRKGICFVDVAFVYSVSSSKEHFVEKTLDGFEHVKFLAVSNMF